MRKVFKTFLLTGLFSLTFFPSSAEKRVKIKIVETSDVHGNYYPYDFINQKDGTGSLARVHTALKSERKEVGPDNLILLDNGDILQGQPTAYYFNFIDTVSRHVGAEMLEFMGYDAVTLGNHDIETGHSVYDRWNNELSIPVLGANIIDVESGKPYVRPYSIIERDGLRIAILGLITPAIPGWLPETLWKGLRFEDMVQSASYWVDYITKNEKPHILIGLFHSGRDYAKTTGDVIENGSLLVAEQVPGFDIVLMGHDHSAFLDFVKNVDGEEVLVANPANNADRIVVVDVDAALDNDGQICDLNISGEIKSMREIEPSDEFLEKFYPQRKAVEDFVIREVGVFNESITTQDAFFGPSAFVDLIHQMQLDISGAQISMAAPLTFNAVIHEGPVTVSDMFNLYKYENMLYTMALTGQEIKDYLEMSYDMWTNTMNSSDDHLLKLRDEGASDMTHTGFLYPSYNFDSAAGIIYTIDVTKPRGEKIDIISLADGSPFDFAETYTVAINSYRGNGGGNLLTEGAGIDKAELNSRILNSTDKDLRFYLMKYIEGQGTVFPEPLNQWKFIPEDMVSHASARDRKILFPND